MTTAKEITRAVTEGIYESDDYTAEPFDGGDFISEFVREEGDFYHPSFGKAEWVDSFRDRDEPGVWVVLYKVEGELYAIYGAYDSWAGTEFYDYDFFPVKKVEKTVVDYVERKES